MPYGDHQALMAQERTAPMAQADTPPTVNVPSGQGAGQQGGAQPPQMPDFGAPTTRPDESVTHGVDIGPGGGSEVLGLSGAPSAAAGTGTMTALLRNLSATDATGILGQLMTMAAARNA